MFEWRLGGDERVCTVEFCHAVLDQYFSINIITVLVSSIKWVSEIEAPDCRVWIFELMDAGYFRIFSTFPSYPMYIFAQKTHLRVKRFEKKENLINMLIFFIISISSTLSSDVFPLLEFSRSSSIQRHPKEKKGKINKLSQCLHLTSSNRLFFDSKWQNKKLNLLTL